jgi:hypothetical protein
MIRTSTDDLLDILYFNSYILLTKISVGPLFYFMRISTIKNLKIKKVDNRSKL